MPKDGEDKPDQPVDFETQQLQKRKAEAEARKAEADARKAEVEAGDLDSPAGRRLRDAKNREAIAEAEQKASAARQQQIAALVPDLSKVKDSTLDVGKEGPVVGGSALTFGALAEAADGIAAAVDQKAHNGRVLVTSDHDLVSPDSLYYEVDLGLTQLDTAADALLEELAKPLEERPKPATEKEAKERVEAKAADLAALPVLGALAAAVPHILSLLSAERSLKTATVTVTDLAAAAAVAGALEKKLDRGRVWHDDFRLVVPGGIHGKTNQLAAKRRELVKQKVTLTDQKSRIDKTLAKAEEELKAAKKALADDKPPTAAHGTLEQKVREVEEQVGTLTQQSAKAAVRVGLVDSLITSMDQFTAAIRVIPTGGRRSPLATAALFEQLHADRADRFTHVLLVKAQATQATQLTVDKPLWFDDKFTTLAEANITYMFIDTGDSRIVRAGTVTATASASGKLGDKITFSPDTRLAGV